MKGTKHYHRKKEDPMKPEVISLLAILTNTHF